MDQVVNKNMLLDTGVIVRILQDARNDRFMIQVRSTLPQSEGRDVEYYLPLDYVAHARAAFDDGVSVDIRGSNETHLMFAELVHTRSLHWTPVESVVFRGVVLDINLQTSTVCVYDRLLDKRGLHQGQKIINLAEALALLSTAPHAEVEIVRVRVRGVADTFRLRLHKLV